MNELLQLISTNIPRVSLGRFPSPVIEAKKLLSEHPIRLIIKHDGVCSDDYAGNKVRKLEFLLAEAQQQNAKHIVTLGSAGSNHAVATSTYARKLGLGCTVCMVDQPPSDIARKNLLRHLHLGTQLEMFEHLSQATQHATRLCLDPAYYLVPLGGSAPLASLGFVVAVIELEQQLEQQQIEMPGRIYVACGTMGTAVGIALGLAVIQQPSEVIAVRVTHHTVANPEAFSDLYAKSANLLNKLNPALMLAEKPNDRVVFEQDFFGEAYAKPTQRALDAIHKARNAGFELEGTYTGKALSALVAHAQDGLLDNQTVLFWNTLNANETPSSILENQNQLGTPFAKYF